MTIYCGVDFHARQQTVCYCDTADGGIQLAELDHQADDVRLFYSRYTGGRRVVPFGCHYDFSARHLRKAEDIPDFLLALRPPAAAFGGREPEELRHVLVTDYRAITQASRALFPPHYFHDRFG